MTANEYALFVAMLRVTMLARGLDPETVGGALYPYRLHLALLREQERRDA